MKTSRLHKFKDTHHRWPTRHERMCLDKQPYPQAYAETEAARLRKATSDTTIHAYRCPQCCAFHVGRAGRKHS